MSGRVTPEQGAAIAQRLADDGRLSLELQNRARGYGYPFRAILEKAAEFIVDKPAPPTSTT